MTPYAGSGRIVLRALSLAVVVACHRGPHQDQGDPPDDVDTDTDLPPVAPNVRLTIVAGDPDRHPVDGALGRLRDRGEAAWTWEGIELPATSTRHLGGVRFGVPVELHLGPGMHELIAFGQFGGPGPCDTARADTACDVGLARAWWGRQDVAVSDETPERPNWDEVWVPDDGVLHDVTLELRPGCLCAE